jgi:hypothetical protein
MEFYSRAFTFDYRRSKNISSEQKKIKLLSERHFNLESWEYCGFCIL